MPRQRESSTPRAQLAPQPLIVPVANNVKGKTEGGVNGNRSAGVSIKAATRPAAATAANDGPTAPSTASSTSQTLTAGSRASALDSGPVSYPQPEEHQPEPASECWVCLDTAPAADLVTPCLCTGSLERVHELCLLRTVLHRPAGHQSRSVASGSCGCGVCGFTYRIAPINSPATLRRWLSIFLALFYEEMTPPGFACVVVYSFLEPYLLIQLAGFAQRWHWLTFRSPQADPQLSSSDPTHVPIAVTAAYYTLVLLVASWLRMFYYMSRHGLGCIASVPRSMVQQLRPSHSKRLQRCHICGSNRIVLLDNPIVSDGCSCGPSRDRAFHVECFKRLKRAAILSQTRKSV
jgi:hypothetical protein